MANAWIKLVKEKFRLGRSQNKEFSLKDAIQTAKKEYAPSQKNNEKKTQKKRRTKGSKRLRRTKSRYSRKNL